MEQYYLVPWKARKAKAPAKIKPSSRPVRRKLVIVGSNFCGKRTLLSMFRNGIFEETRFVFWAMDLVAETEIDGQLVRLALWWTSDTEEYERLGALSYADSDVILICFAIDDLDSFEKVAERWFPEALHYCEGVPIILVGCKKDLRNDPTKIKELDRTGKQTVSSEDAEIIARKFGVKYFECSSLQNDGVREVLEEASRAALHHGRRMKTTCTIL